MEQKIVTILESMDKQTKFAVHLRFQSEEELKQVAEALKPLGYVFRTPLR